MRIERDDFRYSWESVRLHLHQLRSAVSTELSQTKNRNSPNSKLGASALTVKTKILTPLIYALCLSVYAQTTGQEWQQEAVRRYPDLGIRGTPLNNAFVAEYQRRRQSPSEARFFAKANWPVLLADE